MLACCTNRSCRTGDGSWVHKQLTLISLFQLIAHKRSVPASQQQLFTQAAHPDVAGAEWQRTLMLLKDTRKLRRLELVGRPLPEA